MVKDNLLKIENEIIKEIGYSNLTIVAVTKYYNEDKIIEAYEAGLRDFGESKPIEALDKINKLPNYIKKESRFHLIGHLQTNKVSKVVGNFYLIQSVDTLKLAKLISNEAIKKGIVQKILLQINNANEEQKFGFSVKEIFDVFAEIKTLEGIKVTGLMNIAPLKASKKELRKLFKEIVLIRNELEEKFNCELNEISMGMSDDYIEAIKENSTMIRIGRKLFS